MPPCKYTPSMMTDQRRSAFTEMSELRERNANHRVVKESPAVRLVARVVTRRAVHNQFTSPRPKDRLPWRVGE